MPSTGIRNLIKSYQSDDWLTPLYEKALQEDAEPEHWEDPVFFIRPSVAGGACEREMQLYGLGYRSAFAAGIVERMANGTDGHTRITKRFFKAGLLPAGTEGPTRITDENGRTWEADLVTVRPLDGRYYLGEIKTMNSNRYKRFPAQVADRVEMAKLILKAEPKYLRQVVNYYTFLKKQGLPVEEDIFFFLEDTDSQKWKILWFRVDDFIIQDTFKRPKIAEAALREGRLLDPPHPRRGYVCRKCPSESICYQLQDGNTELWEKVNKALQILNGQ